MKKSLLTLCIFFTMGGVLEARVYPVLAEKNILSHSSRFRDLVTDCTERSKEVSCYRAGLYIVNTRKEIGGISYINQSCILGYGKACTLLGDWYRRGYMVQADFYTAKEYYNKGCVRNNSRGCKQYLNMGTPTKRHASPLDIFADN